MGGTIDTRIEWNGDMYTMRELCGRWRVLPSTARQRLKKGQSVEEAFGMARRRGQRRVDRRSEGES